LYLLSQFADDILEVAIMKEHKKFNKPSGAGSIDGMVPAGRQLGERPVAYKSGQVKAVPSLDKFTARTDGFHPTRPGVGQLGNSRAELDEAALLDEPIVLDDMADSKRKKPRFRVRHPRLGKGLKRTAAALGILLLISFAYFGVKIYNTERHLFRGGGQAAALTANVDPNQLKGEGDGRVNILLLGKGGPGHDGPDLTDTIMIASIDPVNNKIALLSIPRDLWVKIPGNGYQKINAAYADGKDESKAKTTAGQEQDGLKLLDQTIEPVIGIPIHYHVVVDFTAFRDVVNALGGVNIDVTQQLYDPTIAWENNWNPVIAKTGEQVMQGPQALLYARSRETSSDFARGQRQRQLLVAIKDKALSAGTFSNPIKISNLLSGLGNNVYTDFSLNDMTKVYQIVGKVQSNQISSVDMVTPPHDLLTTGNISGLSVVEPLAGLYDYSDIQYFIRTTLRDGYLAKENAPVAIYNATNTAGLATATSTTLKSYGYNVTVVDNTPTATNPSTTTLVDLSAGKDKYTRHYLELRFGVSAKTKLPANLGVTPPVGTKFVIILGNDAATAQ